MRITLKYAAVLLLVLVSLYHVIEYALAPSAVTFVAILPLSNAPDPQTAQAKAMQLAVESINYGGGINGRPLRLILEDNQGDPARSIALLQAHEQSTKPLAYFTSLSVISEALAPHAQAAHAPLFATLSSDPSISKDRSWVFQFAWLAEEEGRLLAGMLRKVSADTVLVLYQDELYGQRVAESLAVESSRIGISLRQVAFPVGASDISTLLASAKEYDSVVVVGYPAALLDAVRALRASEYAGHILAGLAAAQPGVVSQPEMENVWLVAPSFYALDNAFPSELRSLYQEHYGESLSHTAASGYAAIQLVADMLHNRQISRSMLQKQLAGGLISPGALGLVEAASGETVFSLPLYPAQIQQGRIRYMRSGR